MDALTSVTSHLKRKRSWIEMGGNDMKNPNNWVTATAKRLKEEHVIYGPLKMLKQLPHDNERDERIEKALTEIVKMEVDQMDEKQVSEFQAAIDTNLNYTALKVLIYGIGTNKNIAWSGQYTYGCSFGRDIWRVFDMQNEFKQDVNSMRFDTKEQFWAQLEAMRTAKTVSFASAASFHKLENDDIDDLYEEGDLHMFVEEMMRVGRIIERNKCTCASVPITKEGVAMNDVIVVE